MNKLKLIAGIFLILTSFTFTSCENEPIDSAINLDDFNTSCDAPDAFQASNFINNSNVNLSWTAGSDETSWEVQYGLQGFTVGAGTTVVSTLTNYTVTGLNPANTYSFYVRANCGGTSNSQWVGPVIVQAIDVNPNCASPTNLIASRNATTNTNVNISWTAGGTETSWEIQYGNTGFALGSGIIITSTASPDLIANINTQNSFSFYIRAACSGTEFSSWIGPVSVSAVANVGIVGNYKLTAFNTSIPTDLNGDGTASTNQLSETNCLNNSFVALNANNTFTADSKGIDIDINNNIACFTDPDFTGTWVLNGNILSLTYTDGPDTITDNYIVNGNTFSATLNDGQVVGVEQVSGEPVYLTCDITIIFTKQ